MNPKRFTEQVVIITGAASGIGRACAVQVIEVDGGLVMS